MVIDGVSGILVFQTSQKRIIIHQLKGLGMCWILWTVSLWPHNMLLYPTSTSRFDTTIQERESDHAKDLSRLVVSEC